MKQSNPTPAVPAEQPPIPIRVCKGPGCTHLIGRGRGPTAIYCSDRCNWRAQNTKKKLSRDAENPHRRTVHRLPQEESQLMDRRLRELCKAGVLGTEIRKILNDEFDLSWTFSTYFQRAGRLDLVWTKTRRAERPWAGAEDLPKDQWKACSEDPAYEARQEIADRVICRRPGCFKMFRDGAMDGKDGHLWRIHRKDLECDDPKKVRKCYRRRHPGAPLFTFERIAKQQGGLDVFKLMAKEADLYATPEQRTAADADPEYEPPDSKYVICREERCGFKSRGRLTKHLANEHGIHGKKAVEAWRRKHNWAPIFSQDYLAKRAEDLKKRNERLRAFAKIGRQLGQAEAPKPAKSRGKVGATAKRSPAFLEEAIALYPKLGSWGKVAKKLTYSDWQADQKGAADRLRLEVNYYLEHRKPAA